MLEAAWQANRARGVVVVGINVQHSDAAARAFIIFAGLDDLKRFLVEQC